MLAHLDVGADENRHTKVRKVRGDSGNIKEHSQRPDVPASQASPLRVS
jgi:hypothetical protein